MNYNYIGLFLIFTNFFCNIIIKLQEYYITILQKLQAIVKSPKAEKKGAIRCCKYDGGTQSAKSSFHIQPK